MTVQKKMILIVLISLLLAVAGFLFMVRKVKIPEDRVADSELAKLAFIIEKYKNADIEVISQGMQSGPSEFLTLAKEYLKRNYKLGDNAENWIKEYSYRTFGGNIIYFKYPDGSQRPMRDVFLEELAILRENEKTDTSQLKKNN